MKKIITAKDIATALNMPISTVRKSLCKNPGSISYHKVALVREYAESVGYDPKLAAGEWRGGRSKYIKESPFNTYSEFVSHCKQLRKNGWTNAEIAKGCGCTHKAILNAIGKQPAEYTAMSIALAGERRVRKNLARLERAEALRKKQEAERKRAEISAKIAEMEAREKESVEELRKMREIVADKSHARLEMRREIRELQKKLEEVA